MNIGKPPAMNSNLLMLAMWKELVTGKPKMLNMKKIITRILLLPLGLIKKIIELSNTGARDIQNKKRFKGAVIDNNVCINQNSIIHSFTHIFSNCILNNSIIESYSYIGRNCLVQNATIGKFCSIANDVFIGLGKHPLDLFSTSPIFYRIDNPLKFKLVEEEYDMEEYSPITIGHDVWIGARAIILDGVSIGNGAVVAANAVVTKNVPDYAIVVGSPAKVLRYRFTEDKIKRLIKSEWWKDDLNTIKTKVNELNI